MNTPDKTRNRDNVFDIFSGRSLPGQERERIIRLSPELDGLEMLYSNDASDGRLFSLQILFWGLKNSGEVVGMVPWMDRMIACAEICDPLNGHWKGYYDPGIDDVFEEPPVHKIVELETAAEYYEYQCGQAGDIVQEVPDTIGTHAVLSSDGLDSLVLSEVISWRLYFDGSIAGMLADRDRVESTPILPGDACLYRAGDNPKFRYFFQHSIANKIKSRDPDAIAAISLLVEDDK